LKAVTGTTLNKHSQQSLIVEIRKRSLVGFIKYVIEKVSPLANEITILCVPGNHGENRKDGKAFTTFGDNSDVAVFEQVAEILESNQEAYGHVKFLIPDEDLTVTTQVFGKVLGFAHGHQAKAGGSVEAKVEAWWKGQQHGRRPVGSADILVTGHFHHLHVKQNGERTWMQCPSLESESSWYKETSGASGNPGILTFIVNKDGWTDLQVL